MVRDPSNGFRSGLVRFPDPRDFSSPTLARPAQLAGRRWRVGETATAMSGVIETWCRPVNLPQNAGASAIIIARRWRLYRGGITAYFSPDEIVVTLGRYEARNPRRLVMSVGLTELVGRSAGR